MRRTPRLGLRAYLTGFFALAALAPTLAALPSILVVSASATDRRAVEGLRSTGQHAGALLARALHVPWREVDGLAAMVRDGGLDNAFRTRLDTVKALDDRLSWLGVAGPNGRVLAAGGGTLEGQDVSERAWFRNGLEGPFAGDVRDAVLLRRALSPGDSGEPLRVLDFSKPLRRQVDGEVLGVIGAHINWDWVRDLIRGAVRPEGGDILLVSRDGGVIVGPAALEGARIQRLRGVLAAGQGVVAAAEEEWPDGGRHLSVTVPVPGYRNMPGFGWSLIVRQPSAIAHAPARAMASRLLPPLLGVSALFLAAGVLLARAIARPLSGLAASAEAMAQGRLDELVPERREHREAAVLSAALARIQSALTARPEAASAAASPSGPRRRADRQTAAALADARP